MTREAVVTGLFPNKSCTPITGKPTFDDLTTLLEKCTDNLAAIPSILGGGQHGLSGLILSDARYFRDTGHHFVDPTYPGGVANTSACTAVAIERTARDQHTADTKQFNTVTTAAAGIRIIITEVLDDVYLQAQKLPITGLATTSIHDIFATLFSQHRKLTLAQISAATNKAKTPWYPTTPIQTLFHQTQCAQDLVEAAGDLYTKKQLVRFGYDEVLHTGVFTDGMQLWRRKVSSAKTWAAFKSFMVEEYKDYLDDVVSKRNNPFNQESHVMQQETLATLTEIAKKFNNEPLTVTKMGEANSILSTANTTFKEQVEMVK